MKKKKNQTQTFWQLWSNRRGTMREQMYQPKHTGWTYFPASWNGKRTQYTMYAAVRDITTVKNSRSQGEKVRTNWILQGWQTRTNSHHHSSIPSSTTGCFLEEKQKSHGRAPDDSMFPYHFIEPSEPHRTEQWKCVSQRGINPHGQENKLAAVFQANSSSRKASQKSNKPSVTLSEANFKTFPNEICVICW